MSDSFSSLSPQWPLSVPSWQMVGEATLYLLGLLHPLYYVRTSSRRHPIGLVGLTVWAGHACSTSTVMKGHLALVEHCREHVSKAHTLCQASASPPIQCAGATRNTRQATGTHSRQGELVLRCHGVSYYIHTIKVHVLRHWQYSPLTRVLVIECNLPRPASVTEHSQKVTRRSWQARARRGCVNEHKKNLFTYEYYFLLLAPSPKRTPRPWPHDALGPLKWQDSPTPDRPKARPDVAPTTRPWKKNFLAAFHLPG